MSNFFTKAHNSPTQKGMKSSIVDQKSNATRFRISNLRSYFQFTPMGVYAAALVLPVFAVSVALLSGLPAADLMHDPLVVADVPLDRFYFGFFSNLGVVLWAGAGAVCLFVAVAEAPRLARTERNFLLCGGGLTLLVMLDDLYMVHENLPALPLTAIYAVATAIYVLGFIRILLRLDFLVLLASIGLLGSSVLLDQLIETLNSAPSLAGSKDAIKEQADGFLSPERRRGLLYLGEDGPKFVGMCAWAAFHVRAAYLLRRP
jgi:hypothetical protein